MKSTNGTTVFATRVYQFANTHCLEHIEVIAECERVGMPVKNQLSPLTTEQIEKLKAAFASRGIYCVNGPRLPVRESPLAGAVLNQVGVNPFVAPPEIASSEPANRFKSKSGVERLVEIGKKLDLWETDGFEALMERFGDAALVRTRILNERLCLAILNANPAIRMNYFGYGARHSLSRMLWVIGWKMLVSKSTWEFLCYAKDIADEAAHPNDGSYARLAGQEILKRITDGMADAYDEAIDDGVFDSVISPMGS